MYLSLLTCCYFRWYGDSDVVRDNEEQCLNASIGQEGVPCKPFNSPQLGNSDQSTVMYREGEFEQTSSLRLQRRSQLLPESGSLDHVCPTGEQVGKDPVMIENNSSSDDVILGAKNKVTSPKVSPESSHSEVNSDQFSDIEFSSSAPVHSPAAKIDSSECHTEDIISDTDGFGERLSPWLERDGCVV